MTKKQTYSWALYDWANSAFATTVMAGFFPIFFSQYWSNPENLSISNLMDKVDMDTDNSGTAMVCESCGTTHQEFKKGGRLGCEACYHVFRPVLDPLLDGMHAGTKHLGKIPSGSASRVKFERSVDTLKTELKDAVEKEDYEKAALVRDKLKELESKAEY